MSFDVQLLGLGWVSVGLQQVRLCHLRAIRLNLQRVL